jgi:hypothetical protein
MAGGAAGKAGLHMLIQVADQYLRHMAVIS